LKHRRKPRACAAVIRPLADPKDQKAAIHVSGVVFAKLRNVLFIVLVPVLVLLLVLVLVLPFHLLYALNSHISQ
jgi:hypothetical protein